MPIYEYICPDGHVEEELYLDANKAPDTGYCRRCNQDNVRIVSAPTFKLGWEMVVNDSGRVWDGTPLEGTDGKNPLYYKSDKIQVDLGS